MMHPTPSTSPSPSLPSVVSPTLVSLALTDSLIDRRVHAHSITEALRGQNREELLVGCHRYGRINDRRGFFPGAICNMLLFRSLLQRDSVYGDGGARRVAWRLCPTTRSGGPERARITGLNLLSGRMTRRPEGAMFLHMWEEEFMLFLWRTRGMFCGKWVGSSLARAPSRRRATGKSSHCTILDMALY